MKRMAIVYTKLLSPLEGTYELCISLIDSKVIILMVSNTYVTEFAKRVLYKHLIFQL